MENNFEKYLNKRIPSLPEIDHIEVLWDKIANELDFNEKLEQTCKTLPFHEYKEHLWDSIQNSEVNKLRYRKLFYLTGIAASILLFIVAYTIYSDSRDYSISYTTEIQSNTCQISSGIENNQNIDKMLWQICQYSNFNCNKPELLQIRNQLSELEAGIQKLNQVITTYGESPELIKCLIIMENQKSDLVDEFLNKIES